VGFFRFIEADARRRAGLVAAYMERDSGHLSHEEAVRDLIRERSQAFDLADVTGAQWIEIDFSQDFVRVEREIMIGLLQTTTLSSRPRLCRKTQVGLRRRSIARARLAGSPPQNLRHSIRRP
jgi:hypothetical protein